MSGLHNVQRNFHPVSSIYFLQLFYLLRGYRTVKPSKFKWTGVKSVIFIPHTHESWTRKEVVLLHIGAFFSIQVWRIFRLETHGFLHLFTGAILLWTCTVNDVQVSASTFPVQKYVVDAISVLVISTRILFTALQTSGRTLCSSVSDPDPHGSTLILIGWIRIRICIGNANPDPDL